MILKLLCHCACALFFFSAAGFSAANKINIQGTFFQNDGVTPITGASHVVDVRLYTNATPTAGETVYFGEKHSNIDLKTDGKFNLLLGQGNLLPEVNIPLDNVSFDKQYFMEVTLDTVTVLGRQPLGSSGYASGSLKNFDITQNLVVSGRIGIGTTSPGCKLHIYDNNQPILRVSGNDTSLGVNLELLNNQNTGNGWIIVSAANTNDLLFRSYGNDVGATRMLIKKANGDIGIGGITNPEYNLDAAGNIACLTLTQRSDMKMKKNVEKLSGGCLNKIKQLSVIKYDWNDTEYRKKLIANRTRGLTDSAEVEKITLQTANEPLPSNFSKKQIGVSAQELETQFPELVSTDSDGYKSVAYGQLSAVLLEAIKEQQSEIEALRQEITQLKNNK